MAGVEPLMQIKIDGEDLAEAFRALLIQATGEVLNKDYRPGPDHDKKCMGWYIPTDPRDYSASFDWLPTAGAMRVSVDGVRCYCCSVGEVQMVRDFTLGDLFKIMVGA